MEYYTTSLSTESVQVNACPIKFLITKTGSEQIREYAISYIEQLVEIKKELAINSPLYLAINYANGTRRYFKYNEEFCNIFSMAQKYEIKENVDSEPYENPYLLQKDDSNPYMPQRDCGYPYIMANSSVSSENKKSFSTESVSTTYTQPTPPALKKKQKSGCKKFLIIIVAIILLFIGTTIYNALQSENLSDNNSSLSSSNDSSTDYYVDSDGNVHATNDNAPVYKPEDDVDLTPVSEPASGTILYGDECFDGSELTITSSGSDSCYVKLKNSYNETILGFYVRAGETITIGVPAEYLYVYFASGDTWYGMDDLFGSDTAYSMDDEILDFTSYTWEYTLYPVTNGNFSETPIDASDF